MRRVQLNIRLRHRPTNRPLPSPLDSAGQLQCHPQRAVRCPNTATAAAPSDNLHETPAAPPDRRGENEMARFDQTMDFVQQMRQLLHFVNDGDACPLCIHPRFQPPWFRCKFGKRRVVKQVKARRIGESGCCPRRFACAARAEEEETLGFTRYQNSRYHLVIFTAFMAIAQPFLQPSGNNLLLQAVSSHAWMLIRERSQRQSQTSKEYT